MKTDQFLRHHGIAGNPFSEEDAQTDTVFKRRCLTTIHHPAWDKFFGSPADPSTALVFGEKGSGKTALRLQAISELEAFNRENPHGRAFVISYDDFNPYLDHFKEAVRAKDTAQALSRWRAFARCGAWRMDTKRIVQGGSAATGTGPAREVPATRLTPEAAV